MDEIIMEALEYVTPKKIDEANATEGLKKAAYKKKAKQEEAVPVDAFEGKDSEQYKEVAKSMKEQFF